MDSSSSIHLDTSWQSLSTSTATKTLDASSKAVMHVVDERGRCLFHPHIILRKKAILGKMGGWKDVLPACPECEKEDTQGGGLSLGSAGSLTKGGLPLVITQLQQTQAAVESSKREAGTVGGEDDDDNSSSSSSSFDNDSSSSEEDESDSSSSQSSDDGGHDQIVDDEVYDNMGEDVNNIKITGSKQNRWVVGKQWARRAEKLRILNDRVKDKLREEMRTAANDLVMDANTNDADFVQAYMSSGSASGGLVQQRQRQQHSTSSSRPSANYRRVVSDTTDSSSSRLAISHQRRSTDSPPYVENVTQHQRKKLDTSERSSAASPSQVIAQHQRIQHSQNQKLDTSERSSGASDSSPSQVIARHQPQHLRRKGKGVSESLSATQSGSRNIQNTQASRRRFATANYDDNDDEMMDQYGDDGKMKKIFYKERTHPAPPPLNSYDHRGKESRRQLHDGHQRERRKTNPEQTTIEQAIARKQHRTRDIIERRPNKVDVILSSTTAEKPSTREGRKTSHGTNRGRLERKDLRGAVPNVKSFDSDVAAYQWDRVPPSEFVNVMNELSTNHETKKVLSEDGDDDDSQRDVLAAVSYQWDRMPDESFMQSTPTLHTRDDLRIQQEALLEKAKTNSWNGQLYPRQSELSNALSVDDLLSLSPGVSITKKDDKAERTVSDPGDNTEASDSIGPPFDQSSLSLGGNETTADNGYETLDQNSSPNHDTSNLRISISSVEDDENEKMLCSTVDRETKTKSSDFTSSTDNIYDTSYRSGEELAEEEGEEEEKKHQLTTHYPVTSSEPPLDSSENSDLTNSCIRLDSGDFKFDLTSLQASKPITGHKINLSLLRASQPNGGLQIDLSALQAYKPIKKQEIEPQDQDQFMQSERTEISDIKTFTVVDLPFTGKLGESGMYSGSVSEQYHPHGKGIMLYDTGELIKGYWSEGDLLRECKLYDSASEGDDDGDDDEEDLSSSMSNVRSKDRGRSRSRSKDRDSSAAAPPPPPKSPPLPEYKVGDSGSRSDMITDKDEASLIIEQLGFGDGA